MALGNRNFGLDLLRAMAIVIVLANHGTLVFYSSTGHLRWGDKWTSASLASIISIEWLFVLSGFLIGAMMIRSFERESTFWRRAKSFWLRRWFRTVPNYFLFLFINVLLVVWGLGPGHYSVLHALFSQNLFRPEDYPYFFTEAWSLAIDEWFYLVMPLLVGGATLLSARPKAAFLVATSALIAVPVLARYLAPIPQDIPNGDELLDWDLRIRRVTVYHLDATGWGVLGAVVSRWYPKLWQAARPTKAIVGLTCMVAGVFTVVDLYWDGPLWDIAPRLMNAAGLGLTGLGTFLALPWIAGLAPRGRLVPRAVAWLSLYSYSIYLAHMPLAYLLIHALPASEAASLPAVAAQSVIWLGLVLAVSAATYHSFEKPVSDLRERYTTHVDANPFTAPPPAPAGDRS